MNTNKHMTITRACAPLAILAVIGCAGVAVGGEGKLPLAIGDAVTNCLTRAETFAVPCGAVTVGEKSYQTWKMIGWKGFIVVTAFAEGGQVVGFELSPGPALKYEKAVAWCKALEREDDTLTAKIIFPGKTNPDVKKDAYCIHVLSGEANAQVALARDSVLGDCDLDRPVGDWVSA